MVNTTYKYVKIFRENYTERLLSGISKLEKEIQNASSPEEAFKIISQAEFICRYLEINPENRITQNLKQRQISNPPYLVKIKKKYKTIGEAIEDFREQKGLSQLDLSKTLGISARTIYRLEKSVESKPSKKTIKRILEVFEISPPEKKEEIYKMIN